MIAWATISARAKSGRDCAKGANALSSLFVTLEDEAMKHEDADICEAMVNWFEEQEIPQQKVASCMAQLLGVMIAGIAPNVGELVKGCVLAHESVLNTALQAYTERVKQRK